ncbi:MAG: hypothetical protein WBX01_12025, partial [Nitrososphaeraceae archaeon]
IIKSGESTVNQERSHSISQLTLTELTRLNGKAGVTGLGQAIFQHTLKNTGLLKKLGNSFIHLD